mmetsp:Transcript_15656/g.26229  ORF Transcript_15656/g.26229 Transcript_15656/m.26229 type:complete len:310 (-) Transcript_15656:161-1090(-)
MSQSKIIDSNNSSKPFGDDLTVTDVGKDTETVILQRYEQIAHKLVTKGYKLDGSTTQRSLIDWSVCFAQHGSLYFDEVQMQLNYTVLHAALLLTIAMPAFIDPPDFESSSLGHWFMGMAGLSSVTNLFSIITATIFSTILNRPYTDVDTMVARVTETFLFVLAIVLDYIGMLSLLVSMLIAGFNSSNLDGSVQLYAVPLVIIIIVFWVYALAATDEMQLSSTLAFKEKYLDEFGQLKKEYKLRIYQPKDVGSMLKAINCYQYLSAFHSQDINDVDSVLTMTREDLIEIGIKSVKDRLAIIKEINRLKDL